jgi:urease accessory protein
VKHTVIEQPAQLDLSFVRRGGRTVFDKRLFRWPFVITRTFLLDAVPAHQLTVILQTSGGAILGDDRLNQRIAVGAGAAVHVTTQGATAIHRAQPDATTREAVRLRVEAGGILEYLPEGRILFPDAAVEQSIDLDCAPGATAIVSDAFTTHDPARLGRSFRRLDSTLTVRRGGEPVMIDRSCITGPEVQRHRQHSAFGSMVFVAPYPAERLSAVSTELTARLAGVTGLYAAASLLPGEIGVGLRLAGSDLRSLRAGFELTRTILRQSRASSDQEHVGPLADADPQMKELTSLACAANITAI